jgi:hypothetical protein
MRGHPTAICQAPIMEMLDFRHADVMIRLLMDCPGPDSFRKGRLSEARRVALEVVICTNRYRAEPQPHVHVLAANPR